MSLTIELDRKLYYENNSNNFFGWLKTLKERFLEAKKIHIKTNIPNITGPFLDMFFQGLRELPECIELICDNNNLSFLPKLPNLKGLDCSNNNLTTLPELPLCENLLCFNNKLKKLPDLPNCINLSCTNNMLENINKLPKCKWLECNYNKINNIELLPNCSKLDCSNNIINSISLQQLNICQEISWDNNNLENNSKFRIFEKLYYK